MIENQQGMIKLCGLWKQQSKGEDAKTYYSGSLSYSTNLLLFPNKYKEKGDKNSDLILYIAGKEKKEDKPKPKDAEDPGEEDIPFQRESWLSFIMKPNSFSWEKDKPFGMTPNAFPARDIVSPLLQQLHQLLTRCQQADE